MRPSVLRPDTATMTGLLTAAGVYLIYNNALPTVTDIRTAEPHDHDVNGARKGAAWKSAALVGLVFLVARDINSYIISGAALVGVDLMYRHANAVDPGTGKIATMGADTVAPGLAVAYPMPDYGMETG